MMMHLRRSVFRLLPAVPILLISACSTQPVNPWERDILAQPGMQFGEQPVNDRFEDHFYFSKEASSGGRGFSGGGCGCN